MGSFEELLHCNNVTCGKQLSLSALVTVCSHIFCDVCSSGVSSCLKCPCCREDLTPRAGETTFIRTNLKPTKLQKALLLAGQCPEVILEIAHEGMSFWAYQLSLDRHRADRRQAEELQYTEGEAKSLRREVEAEMEKRRRLENERNELILRLRDYQEKLADKTRESQQLSAEKTQLSMQLKLRNDLERSSAPLTPSRRHQNQQPPGEKTPRFVQLDPPPPPLTSSTTTTPKPMEANDLPPNLDVIHTPMLIGSGSEAPPMLMALESAPSNGSEFGRLFGRRTPDPEPEEPEGGSHQALERLMASCKSYSTSHSSAGMAEAPPLQRLESQGSSLGLLHESLFGLKSPGETNGKKSFEKTKSTNEAPLERKSTRDLYKPHFHKR